MYAENVGSDRSVGMVTESDDGLLGLRDGRRRRDII